MTVYTMLADGFEEVEALAVIDVLKRADYEVKTVSIQDKEVVMGAHNIGIVADLTWRRADFDQCDMIFLPGGMPGTMHLKEHAGLAEQIREFDRQGKWLAAICAAPSVFGGLGILEGKKAICFPGFEKYLTGADVTPERVVLDGHIFTSKGMGTAIDLGLAIVKEISGEEASEELAKSIQYRY